MRHIRKVWHSFINFFEKLYRFVEFVECKKVMRLSNFFLDISRNLFTSTRAASTSTLSPDGLLKFIGEHLHDFINLSLLLSFIFFHSQLGFILRSLSDHVTRWRFWLTITIKNLYFDRSSVLIRLIIF